MNVSVLNRIDFSNMPKGSPPVKQINLFGILLNFIYKAFSYNSKVDARQRISLVVINTTQPCR